MSGGKRKSPATAAEGNAPAATPSSALPVHPRTGDADFDVLIIGAGLPGLALGLALRDSGLSAGLVDRRQPSADGTAEWDARIYAISPGNARFLHRIGVWSRIDPDRLAPIETMRVLGDRDGARLDFSAFEGGERALAWMVEQRALMAATLGAWSAGGREPIRTGATPVALARERDRVVVQLDDETRLAAKLVVGADGVRSWTRRQAGIDAVERPYGQTAVVANFATALPHHGRAWQWFQDDGGVLAWLPLPGRRMSIVWSAPEAKVAELLVQDSQTFTRTVEAAGHHVLGALEPISARETFPLRYVRPASMIGERTALVGDAAHGIHPLAGQGLNLGYGDVSELADVLRERGPIGDPGSPLLLGRYARLRAWPTGSMQSLTDGLWRLFGAKDPVSASIRNRGMMILNEFPSVKALLMQPAMR